MHRHNGRAIGCALLASALLVSGQALAQPQYPPLPPPDPEVYLDRSGFNELLINQAVFGMQLGSALTTALFEDPLRQTSGLILGLGAGIALPIILTQGKPVPSADVVYINQLQRLGLANGVLTFMLANPSGPIGMDESRMFQGAMAAGSMLGLGASILTKDMLELMPAQATAMGYGYWYGAFTGGMLMYLLDVSESDRAFFGSLLAFSNAGLVATFLLRDYFAVDRSRITWTTIGAGIGAGVGAGFGWLFGGQDASPKLMAGLALAGFWSGAVVTYLYLVPTAGFENRTVLASGSLIGVNERGRLSLGVPTPQAMLLPSRTAGGAPDFAATVNLLEWRSR